MDKAEFQRAYNKNKTPVTDKERSLRDYLDLYIRFKLKVKSAKDLKLDTLPQLRSDLESFRGQIEESYMNNEPAVNRLVDEAFDRSQKDLHLFHFFIPVDSAMKPGDTLKAYLAAQEIPSQLRSSNNNVAQVAGNLTAKYVLVKGNDLGFITVFSLPYAYENLAYGLRTGETSKPYRTSKGWHVFYLAGERKSAGRWRIAQILFSFPPGEPNANTEALKRRADSVHDLIAHGEDFAKLAGYYSDDKMTYMTGGEMPEFGTGKYDPFL
ncbi:MAG: peptidylprolyl isomerase [Chitinophagaceae bacterium]|nr:peptidylprolyl isomerase [Chitinophagaceae bacterium]